MKSLASAVIAIAATSVGAHAQTVSGTLNTETGNILGHRG